MGNFFSHFKILLVFAAHVLTAIAVFCVIGAGAWVLHVVRLWLEAQGIDQVVLVGLHGVELLLFLCDLVATGFWSIMSTIRAIKEIKGGS